MEVKEEGSAKRQASIWQIATVSLVREETVEMSAPKRLFESMLSSEVKGDLLVLFHKNPGLIDSLDGVARRIGRVGTAIQADILDMVNVRILGARQLGAREIIFLDRSGDKAAQEAITEYLKNLKQKTE